MSFCATCGRQRNGSARFCGGCGTEFSDPAPARSDQESPSEDAARPSLPVDTTLLDVDPGVTRVEPPAHQTESLTPWYRPEAPGASPDADRNWQPTQTVRAAPTQAAGYLPPSYPSPVPPPPVFPPSPPTVPPSRRNRGRGLFIAVATLVVLAAGGGAYALATSLGKHSSAQPPANPTVSASTPTAATTQPTTSAATSAPPTPTPTPTPSPTLSLVAISPSVTPNTAEPEVETLLSHYFHGINTHNYPEYASTFNAQELAAQPQSQFESGYSSTADSGMTLASLSSNGNGGLIATVTFDSRQSPSDSVDNSSCNAWTLNFYLVRQGSGYLIGPEPSGYQPTYSDC